MKRQGLMKHWMMLTLMSLLGTYGWAQNVPNELRAVRMENGQIRSFQSKKEVPINDAKAATTYLKRVLQLPADYHFELIRKETDRIGMTHYRLRQWYKDLPLEHATYLVHVSNGNLHSANGNYYNQWAVTPLTTTLLDESTALQNALENVGANVYKWMLPAEERLLKQTNKDPEATYYPKGEELLCFNANTQRYERAWKFNIYAHEPVSRHWVYVSAASGKILQKNDLILHADTPCSGHSAHHGTVDFIGDLTNNIYSLRESGRGGGIETYDLQNGQDYGNAVIYTHTSNFLGLHRIECRSRQCECALRGGVNLRFLPR